MSKITERPLGAYDHPYLPGMMGYDQQYSSKMVGVTLSANPCVYGMRVDFDKMVVPDEVSKEPKSLTEENVLVGSFDKTKKGAEK